MRARTVGEQNGNFDVSFDTLSTTDEDRRRLQGSVERILEKGTYDRQALLQEIRGRIAANAPAAAGVGPGSRPASA